MLTGAFKMPKSTSPGGRLSFVGAYAYVITLLERYDTEQAKREMFMSPGGIEGAGMDVSPHATAEERDRINAKMAHLGFKREEVGCLLCFSQYRREGKE